MRVIRETVKVFSTEILIQAYFDDGSWETFIYDYDTDLVSRYKNFDFDGSLYREPTNIEKRYIGKKYHQWVVAKAKERDGE